MKTKIRAGSERSELSEPQLGLNVDWMCCSRTRERLFYFKLVPENELGFGHEITPHATKTGRMQSDDVVSIPSISSKAEEMYDCRCKYHYEVACRCPWSKKCRLTNSGDCGMASNCARFEKHKICSAGYHFTAIITIAQSGSMLFLSFSVV
jgi:hypothetical protein